MPRWTRGHHDHRRSPRLIQIRITMSFDFISFRRLTCTPRAHASMAIETEPAVNRKTRSCQTRMPPRNAKGSRLHMRSRGVALGDGSRGHVSTRRRPTARETKKKKVKRCENVAGRSDMSEFLFDSRQEYVNGSGQPEELGHSPRDPVGLASVRLWHLHPSSLPSMYALPSETRPGRLSPISTL